MFLRLENILLLFINIIYYTHCSNPLLVTSTSLSQISQKADCVLKLSAKYFVEKKALSGSIVIININSHASTTQGILLKTIHAGMKYSIMVKDSFYHHANASHFPEKAKNYMLILENKLELNRNIQQLNKLPTWNPHAKAVVYYEIENEEDGAEIAIEFINELREHKLLKVIVFIYSPENGEVVSYTWRPYSETNCGGRCDSVYVLDRCKRNIVTQYSKQKEIVTSNMKLCPLVVFAVVSEPYVARPKSKSNNSLYDDVYEFDLGAEIKLIRIISYFMNMSLVIRTSSEPEQWGTIEAHGNATGAFAMLKSSNVDLMVGNVEVTKTIRRWFDPTVSYTQDEMTWCVPKAGRASTWSNLVTIFQWSTWLATFIIFIAVGLTLHYFFYSEHRNSVKKIDKWPTNSLLMTFSMLLGWGATFEPKSLTFRVLITGWLLFSLNLGISYVSFLRSFLLHPRYERQIDTEVDLIKSGMPFGGRDTYRAYFENNNASSYYLYKNYNSTTFIEGIKRAALDRNFAVVASRRQAEYQDQALGKGAKLLFCFPESDNLYKYGVVLLARKWFPMIERFNQIIRSVSENGLISKWTEELFIHSASGNTVSDIKPLGMEHLLGAFMFIGLMNIGSVIVLLCEIMWNVICTKRYISYTSIQFFMKSSSRKLAALKRQKKDKIPKTRDN